MFRAERYKVCALIAVSQEDHTPQVTEQVSSGTGLEPGLLEMQSHEHNY